MARTLAIPSPAQLRALALCCHYWANGVLLEHAIGRSDTYWALQSRRLIRRADEPVIRFLGTVLGREVLTAHASDSTFGLKIDPKMTHLVRPDLVHLHKHGPGLKTVAILLARPLGIQLDLGLNHRNSFFSYWSMPIDRSGTCTVPGSPEGGFARLLDLAVDAGLELPESPE